MNRSRPRTFQFSQSFISVYQVDEFAKLDNISISDVSNNQVQLNYSQAGNNENSNSQGVTVNLSESAANGRNSSNNNQNNLTSSQQNPSNNTGSSIFTTFSGPGQSQQYQKVAFGNTSSLNSAFADKGINAENPEKKRRLQGYSYARLRHEQNLPKPEAYELRDQDISYLYQFNQTYSQNLQKENPNKYEILLAQQKERQEENGENHKTSALNEVNGKQSMSNDGVIFIITEEMLEKLFIHFEKKSTKDTTATLQEVKIELPKEFEENLNPKDLEGLYLYWKEEREREYERQGEKNSEKLKELYPFMRKYWRASNEDISAHAAFRPREINRMKTRKSARPENKETYEKMLSLESDFKKYRLIALKLKKRELLKREIAYYSITEFNQSIPGLTSEFQIFNKFVSRAQEIKNISNLINPKSSKPSKPHKSKPKSEQNKDSIPQSKEQKDEENMNIDESNVVQQQSEVPKKIKINVPKGIELEKKNKFNDETKQVQLNGEQIESQDFADKLSENNQIVNETKKKKKVSKKKIDQEQNQDTEAQENSQLPIQQEVPADVPKKQKKKKKQKEINNLAENSSNIISLQLQIPLDLSISQNQGQSINANEEITNKNEEEEQKPEEFEQEEAIDQKKKTKNSKKEKSEKPVKRKDPKDPKQRKKKNQTDDSKLNEDESIKPDENTQGPSLIEKLDSQSIYNGENEQSRVERQEESQFPQPAPTKKAPVKRNKKQKNNETTVNQPDSAIGGVSEIDIEKDLKEKAPSKQGSAVQIMHSDVKIKHLPLIKLDKDLEIEQFLSSFYIYFHQLKLPITVDNVDSSEKIANKNTEIQEEKKQKLKNPNTLAYLIRKRIGRSNREYLDRTFDSLIDAIGIQSGKISYLLTPNNDIIYNTFNYVNFDAVKTVSSQQNNSNNPYSSSSNPSSASGHFSQYQTSSTSATGANYEDDSFTNPYYLNRRDSKNSSDKKSKNLPGNEKLVHEIREKQRQIFEGSFFQNKQQKLKQVIQQPYLTQLQRKKRRLPNYFHNNHRQQQLWIDDDDSNQIEQDDIFMKNLSNLKQTIEEKQKEKEKKLKLQQKQLQEQLKKQKEIEQKEEAARLLQKQKEEQNKMQEQDQYFKNQQFNQQQMQNNQQHQFNNQQQQFNRQYSSQQSYNNNFGENNNFNNSNANYFPQEPYLTEQNSYQQFNQPPLQNNQSNYYGFDRNGSFDHGMYGESGVNNGNIDPQQNMNMMNDENYQPMNIQQRNHQNSFQSGDNNFGNPPQMQGIQSQQNNIQANQQQQFQENAYSSYYDNDYNNNGFENNFGNQSNYDNNYYQYQNNNDYIQNYNELENNNYLDENNSNNNNNYMDDDI